MKMFLRQSALLALVTDFHISAAVSLRGSVGAQSFEGLSNTIGSLTSSSAFTQVAQTIAGRGNLQNAAELTSEGRLQRVTDLHISAAASLRGGVASQSFEGRANAGGSLTLSSAFTRVAKTIAGGGHLQDAANKAAELTELTCEGRLHRVGASIRSLIWALGEIFFPSSKPTPQPQHAPRAPSAPEEPGTTEAPEMDHHGKAFGRNNLGLMIMELIYGLIYYIFIVTRYPKLDADVKLPAAVKEIQQKNEIEACCHTSCPNNCLSWCCIGPRAAHTFHSTGILNYWPSLCLMTFLPRCTLFWANSCTDLNPRLGGEKRSMLKSLFCSCCCTCCVVAQDAEALDLSTGARTGICGVDHSCA